MSAPIVFEGKYEILHNNFKIDKYLWDACGSGRSGSTHSILRARYQALFDVVPNTESTVCRLYRHIILGMIGITMLTAWFSCAFLVGGGVYLNVVDRR